ncbi:MAG: hypothetical protein M0Z41_17360 [Peptococcaceae bacterium]|jgi:1,4-dihydroxy-2-naphthoate octaprenyltransferase|nr:hypothetical protein [Peptococcaceae bacterium]
MGAVIILISFYIQTGHISTYAVDQGTADPGHPGRPHRAIRLLPAMFAFSYLWIAALVFIWCSSG